MNIHALSVIARNEVRLRLRRGSTLLVLLAVMAVCWKSIADPASGSTLLSVAGHRVLYTSSALAMGSAHLAGLLFGLAGFFLLRGRCSEDLRSGMGGVIGASAASNGLLVVGRWLGAFGYLCLLMLACLGTALAMHLLRGEGPIDLLIYLETYGLLLLPALLFAASCAVLFDHVGPLVGKGGDLLYFVMWCAQFAMVASLGERPHMEWPAMLDFGGISVTVLSLQAHFDTTHFALGYSGFDKSLPTMTLPAHLWSARVWAYRSVSAVLALLPLLPAALLCHRYSPDQVRASTAQRRSLLARVNGWLAPMGRVLHPLSALSLRLPGFAGETLAEAVLALRSSPAFTLAMLVLAVLAASLPAQELPGVMTAGVVCWALLVCDMAPRDFQSGCDTMTGALPGAALRRYVRQWSAAMLLALPFCGIVALRWASTDPLRATAAGAGLVALASAALAMGSMARNARLFSALFLFLMFIAVQMPGVAMLDMVGFNGAATPASAAAYALAGALLLVTGLAWSRRTA